MLKSLSIKNYALIKNLQIDFEKGFITITGETGAGKSILLGAFALILGERADNSVLLNSTNKCIVEGVFDISDYSLKSLFKDNNLDYEQLTIVRREIGHNGKSRAFINDTPVNLSILKEFGKRLVDIHSQNHNLILNDFNYQLEIVDTLSENDTLLTTYKEKYFEYRNLERRIEELRQNAQTNKKNLDYLQFQFEQLNNAGLKDGEQEEIEEEIEVLSHSEEIKRALSNAFYILSENETNINTSIKDVYNLLAKMSNYYPKAKELSDRIDSIYIELNDLTHEIEVLEEQVNFDPARLQLIKERLDIIYNLEQKHQVKSINELHKLTEEIEDQIHSIESFDDEVELLEKEIEITYKSLFQLANELSVKRNKAIPGIENELLSIIKKLGMPDASLKIQLIKSNKLKTNGIDDIKFLFSSNSKVEERDLSRVASGGELSRLMLSVKSLISQYKSLPTIVFDEIDSGISGDIAYKMGEIMANMAVNMQVISITHLAQIASRGDAQYSVFKENNASLPATKIRRLDVHERVSEIAKMLSGESLTDAAIQNAKELLKLTD